MARRFGSAGRHGARQWRCGAPYRSNLDLDDQRHMVRRPFPIAARLEHRMALQMTGELRRGPHMVEPAPAVVLRPVRRAVAPPGEAALGRGNEAAADVDPVVCLAEAG